jgi:dihydrofolate reductase
MKATVYIATSVDGFIAKSDGDIEWLHNPDYAIEGEDMGYAEFTSSYDCLLMGKNSFEKVHSFGFWPYEGKRTVVLSKSLKDLPKELADKAELSSLGIRDLVSKLESEGVKHLYVDGGSLIQSFLKEKMITDIIITQIPILLGDGISLFAKGGIENQLELIESKSYPNGFVQNRFKVLD